MRSTIGMWLHVNIPMKYKIKQHIHSVPLKLLKNQPVLKKVIRNRSVMFVDT